jgi:MSHA biogenesis protein MshP
MRPDPQKPPPAYPPGQRGFSIVTAIFLLVVMAALGTFMLTFSNVQHATTAQDSQGARAYQAARAGIEWGTYRVLINNNCAASTTLPLAGTLGGFNVIVQCTALAPYTEGTNTVTIYQLTSTASTGTLGNINYAERQLQATIGR